jgi:hypothetical protein
MRTWTTMLVLVFAGSALDLRVLEALCRESCGSSPTNEPKLSLFQRLPCRLMSPFVLELALLRLESEILWKKARGT